MKHFLFLSLVVSFSSVSLQAVAATPCPSDESAQEVVLNDTGDFFWNSNSGKKYLSTVGPVETEYVPVGFNSHKYLKKVQETYPNGLKIDGCPVYFKFEKNPILGAE